MHTTVRGRLTVLRPGMLSLIQDSGRAGWAHLGVGHSGAADPAAMTLANRLVGNEQDAPVIEVTNGGLEFEVDVHSVVTVTGAPLAVTVGRRRLWSHAVLHVPPGEPVRLAVPPRGLRSYVAVRGGIHATAVLGSCSSDRLSGLGPPPLRPGDAFPIGTASRPLPSVNAVPEPLTPSPAEDVRLPIRLGPRIDWFQPDAVHALLHGRFEVTAESDRIGLRLSGPALPRRVQSELISEGVVEGSLQAPPGGRLTLLGPDHPVTGGYPVIAVVRAAASSLIAQLRPGQGVRFALDERQ